MRPTVILLKNIKNRSHDTIHTFKNYFITIFLVFSFNNNMSVWIEMIVAFSVSCFPFFSFFLRMNSNLTWVYCSLTIHHCSRTIYHCSRIKKY